MTSLERLGLFPEGRETFLAELIEAARRRGGVQPNTWRTLFDACVSLPDPPLRVPLAAAVDGFTGDESTITLLRPWFEAASKVPPTARDWALAPAEPVALTLQALPAGRDIAPAICLFYARLGRDAQVRSWLERATASGDASWRDRIQVALVGVDLERGSVADARARLAIVETESVRDEGRAKLALALAAKAPAEAASELAGIGDALRQAATAEELSKIPDFARSLPGAYQLLLALQDRGEGLAGLLSHLAGEHPGSPLVTEFARQLRPEAKDAGLRDAVRVILDREALVWLVGKVPIRRLQKALEADAGALERALARAVVAAPVEIGDLPEEDAAQALAALGAERIFEAR